MDEDEILRLGAGIRHVMYVALRGDETPLGDLDGFLKDLLAAGLHVLQVGLWSPERLLSANKPAPVVRQTPKTHLSWV